MRLFQIGGAKCWIEELGFTPDSQAIVAAVGLRLQTFTIGIEGKPSTPVLSHHVSQFAYSPDGRWLLAGCQILKLVELLTRTSRKVEYLFSRKVGFSFSIDSLHFACCQKPHKGQRTDASRVRCFSVADTLVPTWEANLNGLAVIDPIFSPDGERVLIIEQWTATRLLNLSTATGEWVNDAIPISAPEQVIFSPDGRWLAARTGASIRIHSDYKTGLVSALTIYGRRHFTGIAFHPSGRYLAATSNDTTVKVYDTTTWQLVRTYSWNIGRLRSIAFSPDGLLAAAGSDTGRIVVWDVED